MDEKKINHMTSREKKLILFLREMGWGEVKLRVENGQPAVIYEAIRTVRLEETPVDNDKKRKKRKVKPLEEVAKTHLG